MQSCHRLGQQKWARCTSPAEAELVRMLPYCPKLRSGNASWAKLAHQAPPLSAALLWLHLKMRNTFRLNSVLERNLYSQKAR